MYTSLMLQLLNGSSSCFSCKQGQSECCSQSQQSNTWFTLVKHEWMLQLHQRRAIFKSDKKLSINTLFHAFFLSNFYFCNHLFHQLSRKQIVEHYISFGKAQNNLDWCLDKNSVVVPLSCDYLTFHFFLCSVMWSSRNFAHLRESTFLCHPNGSNLGLSAWPDAYHFSDTLQPLTENVAHCLTAVPFWHLGAIMMMAPRFTMSASPLLAPQAAMEVTGTYTGNCQDHSAMDSALVGDNSNRGTLPRCEGIGGHGSNDNLPKQSCCLISVHEKLGVTLVNAQETARTIAPWIQPWRVTITEVHCCGTKGIGGVGSTHNLPWWSHHLEHIHEQLWR